MNRQDFIAYIVFGLFVLFALILVIPGTRVIFSERQLAEKLLRQNSAHLFQGKSDLEIRRTMQKLAREEGFYLSTGDVIVQFPDPTNTMESTGRIGYTLVMLIPVLWLFDFELVAVREMELGS